MARFTFHQTISATPEAVFAYLVDPDRMPRWLPATEAIEHPTGSLAERGATFLQRGAPGFRRPGGVVSADPPRSWHLRLAGMGERVDLKFNLERSGASTGVRLDATIQNGPAVLSPIFDLVGAGIDRRLWRGAIDRLREELERGVTTPERGALVSLESGGMIRIAQVLETDDRHVHLRLFADRRTSRPEVVDAALLGFGRPKDQFGVRPLDPKFRAIVSFAQRGAPSLLADGGFGLAHFPVTLDEFRDADPRPAGHAAVPDGSAPAIAEWRSRGGAAFGEKPAPRVGAFYSVALQAAGIDAIGFGVVKLVHCQFRGVHLRTYSTTFLERPAFVAESVLETRGVDLGVVAGGRQPVELPSMPHLALKHASFAAWKPEFVAMALVDPDERRPFEEWKFAKGGFI